MAWVLATVAAMLELGAADWTVSSSGTQVVGADAAYGAIAVDAPSVTFDVAPGATLSADAMTVKSTAGASAFTLSGGGVLSLDDRPFNVGDGPHPVSFTVAGPGTTFVMPKTAASGLYIGQVDQQDQPWSTVANVLHVTDGARVLVSNAVCVGTGIRADGTAVFGKGRLLVDGGASLHGGVVLFAGRGVATVTAVTNATITAEVITSGDGEWNLFLASNAVMRAGTSFNVPHGVNGRFQRLAFEDSLLSAKTLNVGHYGRGNTGRLDRCALDVENLVSGTFAAWNSSFTLTDCAFTSRFRDLSSGGASNASNCVLRLVRTPVAGGAVKVNVGGMDSDTTTVRVEDSDLAVNSLVLGTRPDAAYSRRPRYEQAGGSLSVVSEVNVGKYVSEGAVAELRGLASFATPKIICGDSAASRGPRLVLADTPSNAVVQRLWVGNAASGARVHVTNAVLDVVYAGAADSALYHTGVGRVAGAVSNELLVEDGALRQTGGHFYIGQDAAATGNVLRLVRATCSYATVGGKGDFAVGLDGSFNRVVMTNAVFRYDRRFLAIGQNATATDNVWELADGSRLEAPDAQLHVGFRGARSRLALLGGSTAAVRMLSVQNGSTFEVAGTGNVVTVGNEDYSLGADCAVRFRPPAVASETPMLTFNRNLGFTTMRKLTVDFAGTGAGTHVLVSSSVAQNEPVKGVNVELVNVRPEEAARIWRSADGLQLLCSLAPKGLVIQVR